MFKTVFSIVDIINNVARQSSAIAEKNMQCFILFTNAVMRKVTKSCQIVTL